MGFDNSSENYLKSSDHSVGSDLEYFTSYFKDKRFAKAIDVACAAGHFANVFPADEVFSTDLSFNMLQTAKKEMGFYMPALSKAEFLPYKSDTFDLVGCRIAMHHFRNPCMFMNEVFRVLKNGGLFVLIDSVVGKVEDADLNRLELIRDTSHHRSLQVEEIIGIAEAENFLLEDVKVFLKLHKFDEWARRLKPSDEQYEATCQAFLTLPDKIKKELRLIQNGDKIESYTDKKGFFCFKKP
ncbi:MAG: SAM-dependent methyltransferase [Denitrovibrio sp.]|nr:MAG: SAM-dependent methyltransferase [Denitrovibrio sp.]